MKKKKNKKWNLERLQALTQIMISEYLKFFEDKQIVKVQHIKKDKSEFGFYEFNNLFIPFEAIKYDVDADQPKYRIFEWCATCLPLMNETNEYIRNNYTYTKPNRNVGST